MKNFLHIRKQLIQNSTKDWGNEGNVRKYWIENKKIIDIISNVCELVTVPDNVTILPMQHPSMLILHNKKEIIADNRTYIWNENGIKFDKSLSSNYEASPVIADCQMFRTLISTNIMFKNFDEDIRELVKSIDNLLESYSRHYVGKRIAYCPYSLNLQYNPEWKTNDDRIITERIIPFWRSAKKVI